MSGITLQQAKDQLQFWIDADAAVSQGQSYTKGSRTLTRANAAEITDKIKFWDGKVKELSSSASAPRRAITQVIPL